MLTTLRRHWPEYMMEALGLGLFLVSAGAFGTLLEHPASPAHAAIPDPTARRLLMGLAMGLTAVGLIYSPWGRRSGAHLNPAATLIFWRLGKVAPADAGWYAGFQFLGGAAGAGLVALVLGEAFVAPPVAAVATVPGPAGVPVAFAAEVAITFLLISVVLRVNARPRLAPYTGWVVGGLVATYIAAEAPLSGMSMNPARTVASAVVGGRWDAVWVYFLAPPLGMLLAAEVFLRGRGRTAGGCAKMYHDCRARCIFCEFHRGRQPEPAPAAVPQEVLT